MYLLRSDESVRRVPGRARGAAHRPLRSSALSLIVTRTSSALDSDLVLLLRTPKWSSSTTDLRQVESTCSPSQSGISVRRPLGCHDHARRWPIRASAELVLTSVEPPRTDNVKTLTTSDIGLGASSLHFSRCVSPCTRGFLSQHWNLRLRLPLSIVKRMKATGQQVLRQQGVEETDQRCGDRKLRSRFEPLPGCRVVKRC